MLTEQAEWRVKHSIGLTEKQKNTNVCKRDRKIVFEKSTERQREREGNREGGKKREGKADQIAKRQQRDHLINEG